MRILPRPKRTVGDSYSDHKGIAMLALVFLHGSVEIEAFILPLNNLAGVGMAWLRPRKDCLRARDPRVVLPDVRLDVFGSKDLPLVHREIVPVRWRFSAPGEDVERIASDDRSRICRVIGSVG